MLRILTPILVRTSLLLHTGRIQALYWSYQSWRGQREHLGNYLVLHTLQQQPPASYHQAHRARDCTCIVVGSYACSDEGEGVLGVWGFYGQVGKVQENPLIASNAIPIGFLSTPHSMVPKHTHSPPNKLYVLIERTQINMTLWRNSKSSNLIFSSFTAQYSKLPSRDNTR